MDRAISGKNAIYIGHIGAEGTAMSLHTRNIASLLEQLDFHVSFACKAVIDENKKYGQQDQFEYLYSKQYLTGAKTASMEWLAEEIFGLKLKRLVVRTINEKQPELVVFYGYTSEKFFIKYCKRKKIKFIVDRTDWFEPDDAENRLNYYLTKYIANRCVEKHDFNADGVISISRYFAEHYENGGQKTIWLPPLIQKSEDKRNCYTQGAALKLVYAGSLGGTKDIVMPVIDLLIHKYNSERIRLELHLVGISEKQLNQEYGHSDWNAFGIIAHGQVPHREAEDIVSKSDFSLLLRHNKRYAKAGFSTKFAESLMNYVPVICTAVGGADSIIENGIQGFLLTDNSNEEICRVVDQLLALSQKEIEAMQYNAHLLAMRYFDKSLYLTKINQFLEKI